MDKKLLDMLEQARSIADVPFVINSAIRCEAHNARSGGVGGSSHLTGNAVDIRALDSYTKYRIVYGLFMAGFKRIGIYSDFVHCDNDPGKPFEVLWG